MPLTATQIKAAEPAQKVYRLPDRDRMALYVLPTGSKVWRWAYRLFDPAAGQDRQFELTFGEYPTIDLKVARARRAKAAEYVARGEHPPESRHIKKSQQAKQTQEAQAETVWHAIQAWMDDSRAAWVPKYAQQIQTYMERYFGPRMPIGIRPFAKVTRNELTLHFKAVASGTLETWDNPAGKYVSMARGTPSVARLCKVWVNSAFEHACDAGLLAVNPIANVRTAKVAKAPPTTNSPVLKTDGLRTLLAGIRNYGGSRQTGILLELLAHLVVRSSELREARWSEFDIPNAIWTVPASRMKMKREHRVPLTPQALALLAELREIAGKSLLFQNANDPDRPMAQSSAREAAYRLTGKAFSPHGFRSTFSTSANEGEVAEPHVIDAVLAHRKRTGTAEGSYNQATYFLGRQRLMGEWSDYLESLTVGPHQDASHY